MNRRASPIHPPSRRAATVRRILLLALLCAAACPIAAPAGREAAAVAPVVVTPPARMPAPTYPRRLGAAGPAQPRAAQPVRIKIPTIGVDAPVEQVGKTPDGAMDVPKDFNDTAWYQPGPRPGEPGNAVIDGHVDSTTGTAVFWDLHKLVRGDEIVVVGDDGVERRFTVTGSEAYPHTNVPLERVFGAAPTAHLNLITCDASSSFDFVHREYAGNLVVYADALPN